MSLDDQHGQLISKYLWWEPLYIALLAIPLTLPDKIIPIQWHGVLVIFLFLGWPLRWLRRHKQPLHYTPLRWPLMIILLWLPVNLWVAIDSSAAWIAAGHLLLGVALYVALINWQPVQEHPQWIAYGLCAVGSLMALFAPPFIQWKPRFRLFHLPIYDLFGAMNVDTLTETIHANVLAGVLVMILPLLVALLFYKKPNFQEKTRFLSLWAAMLLIAALLMLTQSRGAYLAGIVAVSIVALFRWQRLFYGLPLVCLAIGWAIYHLGSQTIFELLGADNTFGGAIFRSDVWGNSVYALSDFVFTGIGMGNFNQVVPVIYPFAQVNGANAYHAHNLYLQIGLDLGLPGAIAYGALVINAIVLAWTARSGTSNSLDPVLAIGTMGSIAAMLVHGLLDAVTWSTKLAFMPWIFYAQIVLIFRRKMC